MTHRLYCLDWHNNKTVAIITSVGLEKFSSGDKLVYQLPGERGGQSIATYLGLEDTKKSLMRTGEYLDHLAPDDKKYFDTMQQQAQKKYPLFKKKFKHHFPDAIPVTARYHIFAEQYYFYFYSEERFNFVEFIKEFREDLKAQFFLFQVGARDMIKMSPATDDIVGCNGINLCCKSNRPLPSIDVEMLVAQHLEGRDIERLKGRCGKLKCSLIYEAEQYLLDNKKFPAKGDEVETSCGHCGMVSNLNVITGKIQVRDSKGLIVTVDLTEIKKKFVKQQQDRKINKRTK